MGNTRRSFKFVFLFLLAIAAYSCGNSSDESSSEQVCEPQDKRCADSTNVEICLEDGSGWSHFRTCEEDLLCCNSDCHLPSECFNDNVTDGDDDEMDSDPQSDVNLPDGDLSDSDESDGDLPDGDLDEEHAVEIDDSDEELDSSEIEYDEELEEDLTQEVDNIEDHDNIDDQEDSPVDGDRDFETIETPEECIIDKYGDNTSWETAYEVPWEIGTLDNIVWCPGVNARFFKFNFTPGRIIVFRPSGDSISGIHSEFFESGQDEDDWAAFYWTGAAPFTFRAGYDSPYMLELWPGGISTITVNHYHLFESQGNIHVESDACENALEFDGNDTDSIGTVGRRYTNLIRDDYSGSCTGEGSDEVVFKIYGLTPGQTRFLMIGADYNINAYMRTDCENPDTEFLCQNDGIRHAGGTFELPASEIYVFIETARPFDYGTIDVSIF